MRPKRTQWYNRLQLLRRQERALKALGACSRTWKHLRADGATEGVANQAANEAFHDAYKSAQGCMDCDGSQQWPAHALQPWPSWRYILEVSKCDVVCGHHHDVRTEARAWGIERDEAARRIGAARRSVVLGATRAERLKSRRGFEHRAFASKSPPERLPNPYTGLLPRLGGRVRLSVQVIPQGRRFLESRWRLRGRMGAWV